LMESVVGTMGFLFGLIITVVGIMLQVSTNRFSSQITSLFFRDLVVALSLGSIMLSNSYSLWVYLAISTRYVPRAAVLVALFLTVSQLILLFPFFAYMFSFMETDKVIQKIMSIGLFAAAESFTNPKKSIDKQQVKTAKTIENLMEAANKAVEKKDKIISAQIVNALCALMISYAENKAGKLEI
jgi:uncharacterized membrane protein